MNIDKEIEKLKLKRVELASKLNLIIDFDEKEEVREKIEELDRQIKVLEKLK